ncbi:MAG: metallopeptidase TldD-related protein, partial [Candidatus Methanomethylicia archaeon]
CIPKEPIETGIYPALIGPRALVSILSYVLYPALNASFHPRILKPGIQLGSENFNLIEDPWNHENSGASPIDHEGTIRGLKNVIERGVLKTLLYDQYYAETENLSSTGNGFRSPLSTWPRLTKPYQAVPKPQYRSLMIKAGVKSVEDLAGEIGEGIFVEEVIGAHGADPASGRFTATASLAFKIEGGSITKPIKHATIIGDLRELLNVIEVSSNVKQVQNAIAPTIMIPKIVVAGEK